MYSTKTNLLLESIDYMLLENSICQYVDLSNFDSDEDEENVITIPIDRTEEFENDFLSDYLGRESKTIGDLQIEKDLNNNTVTYTFTVVKQL